MSEELFDVVAVRLDDPNQRRLIAERKTERNAEAIVMMAVARRGVEEEFFDVVPHGTDRTNDFLAALLEWCPEGCAREVTRSDGRTFTVTVVASPDTSEES
jgi:hypothetical protein